MRFRPISIFAFPMDGELTKPSASAIHLVHPLTPPHDPPQVVVVGSFVQQRPSTHLLKSTQVSPISIKIIIIIYALPLYWTTQYHHPHLHTHPQNVPGI